MCPGMGTGQLLPSSSRTTGPVPHVGHGPLAMGMLLEGHPQLNPQPAVMLSAVKQPWCKRGCLLGCCSMLPGFLKGPLCCRSHIPERFLGLVCCIVPPEEGPFSFCTWTLTEGVFAPYLKLFFCVVIVGGPNQPSTTAMLFQFPPSVLFGKM